MVAWVKQEETDAQWRSLKNELDVLKQEHDSLRQEHDSLKERFDCLEGSSTEEGIHHCFISCIKHNALQVPSKQDYYHINNGNSYTHDGNCVQDAHLYKGMGGHTDFSVFEKIYGLSPAVLCLEIDCKFLLFHEDEVNN